MANGSAPGVTKQFQGKTALVTGGATGFDKAIVEKFASQGANVLVMDIRKPSTETTRNGYSTSLIHIQGDISSLDDWKRALEHSLSVFGHLDIVVNNAGVLHKAQPSIELSDEDWELLFRINVKGIHYSTKTIIPYFVKAGKSGIFVNVSSMSGARPRPNLVWYGASKGAVNTVSFLVVILRHNLLTWFIRRLPEGLQWIGLSETYASLLSVPRLAIQQ